ncbi:MAG: ornithine carbamoyltransferase [Gammaproteobacteria bacterium]|nr:ornithine carbamoyltransferase [Gammaproteobacteria bacterium]
MSLRHFLTLMDLSPDELVGLIQRAIELKANHARGQVHTPLNRKVMAMIFEKASTRTRVSFESGMSQLGGHAIFLSPNDTQLGRGESVEDSARALSGMVDIIMVRTFEHDKIQRFADAASVPVINALTDLYHPCQLLADVMTWVEQRGEIRGRTAAWIGDGNNMCHSWMNAARQFDFKLRIATPEGYGPDPDLLQACAGQVELMSDPQAAVAGADLVVTDVWASMGQESEQAARMAEFAPFQVNETLMTQAGDNALFMHCLPAHRGEEVSAGVIDGPQSVVWQEAANRLHGQKALLEFLLR